ncbi:MAG: type VII toxin-antitoxin system HepT family RNase toxin [Candidatus Thorarchaeota archaeon]
MYVRIQSTIDLSLKIIGRLNGAAPYTYSKAFEVLAEKSLISSQTAKQMAQAARLRKVMAHRYGSINMDVIAEVVSKHLDDFHVFISELEKSLTKKGIDIFDL